MVPIQGTTNTDNQPNTEGDGRLGGAWTCTTNKVNLVNSRHTGHHKHYYTVTINLLLLRGMVDWATGPLGDWAWTCTTNNSQPSK